MILDTDSDYRLFHGDCIATMHELADMYGSFADFACLSPPFPQLYSYSSAPGDIGNSENFCGDAKIHLSFFYRALARAVKPGRVIIIHVCQIPRMKRAGGRGMFDFRGFNIRLAERAGLIYTYDWLYRQNPQAQAIRTKSRELQFSGLESDRAKSRGALGDYLLRFETVGDNSVPIDSEHEVSRNDWIEWAECCWRDIKPYRTIETPDGKIKRTDTLNVKDTKSEDDTKHICPFALGMIRRLVKLYTNPGEIVLDPFNGIGSTGYVSLKEGRRYVGIEMKKEYYDAALKNLEAALRERQRDSRTLFDNADDARCVESDCDEQCE